MNPTRARLKAKREAEKAEREREQVARDLLGFLPKGSKYLIVTYSRYLVGTWPPKVYTILLLGLFGVVHRFRV